MVTVGDIHILAGSGRRTEAAKRLLDAWRAGTVTVDDLRGVISDIWLYVDPPAAPYGPLAVADWLELFRAVGFFVQGPPVPVDHERWVLYRAAPEDRVRSMAWSTNRVMAELFVPKHTQFGDLPAVAGDLAENVNSIWPHHDHLIWPHQVNPGQSRAGGESLGVGQSAA